MFLCLFSWKNFIHDRIFLGAGSLAFQTLLSIVPILAVILSILNVFVVFAPFKRSIEDFLVQNFMPGAGTVLNQLPDGFYRKDRQRAGSWGCISVYYCTFSYFNG